MNRILSRFYLPTNLWEVKPIYLPKDESNHCNNVLRLKINDEIEIFDGLGNSAKASIISQTKNSTEITFEEITDSIANNKSLNKITLLQSITKPKSMDLIIQKATELGVNSIVSYFAENSVIKSKNFEDNKLNKWQRIAIETCKQCGINTMPTIHKPLKIDNVKSIYQNSKSLKIIGSLRHSSIPLKIFIDKVLADKLYTDNIDIIIATGPEGDFSNLEYETFSELGFMEVNLGSNTLRSETASLYVISILKYFIS